MTNLVNNGKCFIITPIGEKGSEIFNKTNAIIDTVIRPLLTKYGFTDIKAAHEIKASGSINGQIVRRIINDDLCIANLTGLNPNVMYELAVRHITAKPVIHICEDGTVLPFDLKDNRTIFFADSIAGTSALTMELEEYLKTLDFKESQTDNPIFNADPKNIRFVPKGDIETFQAKDEHKVAQTRIISNIVQIGLQNQPNHKEIYTEVLKELEGFGLVEKYEEKDGKLTILLKKDDMPSRQAYDIMLRTISIFGVRPPNIMYLPPPTQPEPKWY